MIRVVSKKEKLEHQLENANDFLCIDCTSHNNISFWAEGLSPFHLGPVHCYDDLFSNCVENAWQYAKVYENMVDEKQNPTFKYTEFRNKGFCSNVPTRYPMGKGMKPLYSYWKIGDNYYKLDYIQARKLIYIPLYAKAVVKTSAFQKLKELMNKGYNIALSDFDGYNNFSLNMSYKDVVNCTHKTMGHSFVIAMLLEDYIKVIDDEVIFTEKLTSL